MKQQHVVTIDGQSAWANLLHWTTGQRTGLDDGAPGQMPERSPGPHGGALLPERNPRAQAALQQAPQQGWQHPGTQAGHRDKSSEWLCVVATCVDRSDD
ncbi:MAG: hypothetical protein KDA75_14365 [Planctomycetaceae bacterium]|nr:hypothetical protein [Planctomycetaceae bacterium]